MYTADGLLPEVAALFVGFDNGVGPGILGGFQTWMSDRHPDHPEHTFFRLALEEVVGAGAREVGFDSLHREDSERAALKLIDLLDEYLVHVTPPMDRDLAVDTQ